MPASLHDRYVALYQKFGEAWRVSDATSLFDYAPVECYRVDQATSPQARITVRLEDQFAKIKTRLGRITQICTPVDKNGEGIPDEDLHLVCYQILDRHDPQRSVRTTNQFGQAMMVVRESQELCVPSTKRELERR